MPRRSLQVKRLQRMLIPRFAASYFLQYADLFHFDTSAPLVVRDITILDRYHDQNTFAFIAAYQLSSGNNQVCVVGRAHSGHIRKYEAHMHTQLYALIPKAHTFMPQPYFYDSSRRIFFVSWLEGEPLVRILLKRGSLSPTNAKEIIKVMNDLQRIRPGRIKGIEPKPRFATLLDNLSIIRKRRPAYSPLLERHWHRWKKIWPLYQSNMVLAHGDFHASHLIAGQNVLGIIDFERMHRGPKLWDLATFLTHLETAFAFRLSRFSIEKMQRTLIHAWETETHRLITGRSYTTLQYFMNYFRILGASHYLVWGKQTDTATKRGVERIISSLENKNPI